MAYYLMLPSVGDIFLLLVILSLLVMSVYIGRYLYVHYAPEKSDGELIITTGTVALLVILIGFAFSVSINGFISLQRAQDREARAVENAWQYTVLLPERVQQKSRAVLRQYLDERIHFFRENSVQGGRSWGQLSVASQRQLWQMVTAEALHAPSPLMAPVLAAFSELRMTQQHTTSVSRRKIPDAAWLVLILFSMLVCCIAGRENAHRQHYWLSMLVLPVMIALSLFIIAEIDVPGEGMIRVTPDDLEQVGLALPVSQTGGRGDPTRSVYHAH
jgi:hypothetical protein